MQGSGRVAGRRDRDGAITRQPRDHRGNAIDGAGFGGSREEDVSGDSDDDCPGGESEYAGDDDAEVEVENVGDRTLTLLERERREDLVLAAAVEVFRCCTRDCLRFKLRRVCVRSSPLPSRFPVQR